MRIEYRDIHIAKTISTSIQLINTEFDKIKKKTSIETIIRKKKKFGKNNTYLFKRKKLNSSKTIESRKKENKM